MEDRGCPLCEAPKETVSHLFLECMFSRAVAFASHWGLKWNEEHWSSIEELVSNCLCSSRKFFGMRLGKEEALVVLVCILETIWNVRNAKIHEGKVDVIKVVRRMETRVNEIISTRSLMVKIRVEGSNAWV